MPDDTSRRPVTGGRPAKGMTNRDGWPNQSNLGFLHQHSFLSDPLGEPFPVQSQA